MEPIVSGFIIFILVLSLLGSSFSILHPNYSAKRAISKGSPISSDSSIRLSGLVWLGIVLTFLVYFVTFIL